MCLLPPPPPGIRFHESLQAYQFMYNKIYISTTINEWIGLSNAQFSSCLGRIYTPAHCVFFKGTVSPDTGLYSRFWKSKSVLSVGRHMVSAFFILQLMISLKNIYLLLWKHFKISADFTKAASAVLTEFLTTASSCINGFLKITGNCLNKLWKMVNSSGFRSLFFWLLVAYRNFLRLY
jgi:hypothetical protein